MNRNSLIAAYGTVKLMIGQLMNVFEVHHDKWYGITVSINVIICNKQHKMYWMQMDRKLQ